MMTPSVEVVSFDHKLVFGRLLQNVAGVIERVGSVAKSVTITKRVDYYKTGHNMRTLA